jgi:hypothetical protein
MKRWPAAALALAATALAGSPAAADPAKPPAASYVAEGTTKVGERQGPPWKIYVAPGLMRQETGEGARMQVKLISLGEKRIVQLFAEQKKYLVMPGAVTAEMFAATAGGRFEVKKHGAETVNGFAAEKWEMSGTLPGGFPVKGFVWLTRENIKVRSDLVMQAGGQQFRTIEEVVKLSIGPIDPALFRVPADYVDGMKN